MGLLGKAKILSETISITFLSLLLTKTLEYQKQSLQQWKDVSLKRYYREQQSLMPFVRP